MNLRMRLVLPELGLPMTMRSILTLLPSFMLFIIKEESEPVDQYNNEFKRWVIKVG
jgi:hypothetical protein